MSLHASWPLRFATYLVNPSMTGRHPYPWYHAGYIILKPDDTYAKDKKGKVEMMTVVAFK